MKTKLIFLLLTVLLYTHINAQCWQTISAGGNNTIAIKNDGTLWAWGSNQYGQFGNGTTINQNTPTQIGTDTDWKKVSAGLDYTIAIKTNGTLWAWGHNNYGQIGNGTIIDNYLPSQIGTSTNWNLIDAGDRHIVAIKTNGTLWAWGWNGCGGLGNGSFVSSNTPIQIGIDTSWQSISSGSYFTVAIKSNGTLWTWGINNRGQLGNGSVNLLPIIANSIPIQIGFSTNWGSIATGERHVVAIKTNGTLWTWGFNGEGQLGDGTAIDKHSPIQIGIATNWKSVSAGALHTVAIKVDGTLWAWGNNGLGQIGQDLLTRYYYSPQTVVNSSSNNKLVETGSYHNCIIKTDGTLASWGYNSSGQLGDGTNIIKITPTIINCPALGLENIPVKYDSFLFYPNPVNDIICIQNISNLLIDYIIVTDLTGKKVFEQNGSATQINTQELQKGMYLLQVFSGDKSFKTKFIKQ